MELALLLVGTELVSGHRDDTNTARVAKALATRGRKLGCVEMVPDRPEAIVAALERLAAVWDELIVCGGLGATTDDLTRDAVAAWLGQELLEDPEARAWVEHSLAVRGYPWHSDMARHARLPRGATRLHNPTGLAAGFSARREKLRVSVFPGVPSELEAMLPAYLDTLERAPGPWFEHHFVLFGVGEQIAERRLLEAGIAPPLILSLLPQSGPLDVGISGSLDAQRFEAAVALARNALREHLVCENQSLPEAVGERLVARAQTVACAESCTGGLLASLLTDVPGSSRYLNASIVTYSNQAKTELLGVRPATLETHGAVSEQTVLEMARGVRTRCASDWGVAISGVAGPGGGSDEKPVGTVFIAVASEHEQSSRHLFFPRRSRLQIKRFSAFAAMTLLLERCRLHGDSLPSP